ncbi:MAG: septal ring lytic transglycosylase RlpA family protein [Henriciella sp.]
MRLHAALIAVGLLVGCSHQDAGSNPKPSDALACAGASYYADSLAGNPTASGEPYVPSKLTAAHRTLPFGTKVRVVREGRGEVTVTVNDRGPFIDGRIIDLSRAAAEKVDLITDGVAQVCLYAVN